MSQHTPIYGHSGGYRALSLFAVGATAILILGLQRGAPIGAVRLGGILGFAALSLYAWQRFSRRTEVLRIMDNGFAIQDPAQPLGLIEFDEIAEIRIYALLERPRIAFQLHTPHSVRCRAPVIFRLATLFIWQMRHYQVVVELDEWNDQLVAIKSVAVRAGIPIRSELI